MRLLRSSLLQHPVLEVGVGPATNQTRPHRALVECEEAGWEVLAIRELDGQRGVVREYRDNPGQERVNRLIGCGLVGIAAFVRDFLAELVSEGLSHESGNVTWQIHIFAQTDGMQANHCITLDVSATLGRRRPHGGEASARSIHPGEAGIDILVRKLHSVQLSNFGINIANTCVQRLKSIVNCHRFKNESIARLDST
ncbi:hypothetical protein J8273_4211 [Carpediemonas membranifera]|uniref:Uncharacterized protein n=1 Tax=Carpediemonas membranifera TaxID=201153 RepID=A0A8J6E4J2_9EUKA|nr:hypothetical protein J8273_4211 [Carpediemonas membranifera]|eukprot:KAG9394537.1 hypothetical protein J8273_4211 [Carpediemonas membranifera]